MCSMFLRLHLPLCQICSVEPILKTPLSLCSSDHVLMIVFYIHLRQLAKSVALINQTINFHFFLLCLPTEYILQQTFIYCLLICQIF